MFKNGSYKMILAPTIILILGMIGAVVIFANYDWFDSIPYFAVYYTYGIIILAMIPMVINIIIIDRKWKRKK